MLKEQEHRTAWLKHIMRRNGVSLRDLADACEVSPSHLSTILSNKATLTEVLWESINGALVMEFDCFFPECSMPDISARFAGYDVDYHREGLKDAVSRRFRQHFGGFIHPDAAGDFLHDVEADIEDAITFLEMDLKDPTGEQKRVDKRSREPDLPAVPMAKVPRRKRTTRRTIWEVLEERKKEREEGSE